MDHRCPVCRADLGARKLSQAIVARMEMDCPQCSGRIRLRLHRAEVIVVLVIFGALAVLGGLAYWYRSEALVLFTVGTLLAGSLALPLLERTWLRTWPRYEAIAPSRDVS